MTLAIITEQDADYRELIMVFPPRVIHDETDYLAVQTQVDRVIDQADLTSAEQAYLDLLTR